MCVATFNGAKYIRQQLESILSSECISEVLVSDDGSTDGTQEIVRSFSDARISLMSGPQCGVIKNFEKLLMKAKGDYIFLSDQDDVWFDDKVGTMIKALEGVDLVVCDCEVVSADLKIISPSFFDIRKSGGGVLYNLWRNSYLGCCMAFNRRLLTHALPFPKNIPMHDWWLGLIAEVHGKTVFIDTPLMSYRRHGENISSTAEKSNASLWTRLKWRTYLLAHLLKRKFCISPS